MANLLVLAKPQSSIVLTGKEAKNATSYAISNVNSGMYTLVFSNDPATYDPTYASQYVAWTPGRVSFPLAGSSSTVGPAAISKVGKNAGESKIVLPADCTGLFKDMAFGIDNNSCYAYEDFNNGPPTHQNVSFKTVTLDFSIFDTSEVEIMDSMFENCVVTNNIIRSYTYSNSPIKVKYAYQDIRFSGLSTWDLSNVTSASRMFTNINVYGGGYCYGYSISYPDLYKWHWNITDYRYCVHPLKGTTFNFPSCTNATQMFAGSNVYIKNVTMTFTSPNKVDFTSMFEGAYLLEQRDAEHGVQDFDYCINLSTWYFGCGDANMQSMFKNTDLKVIDLGPSMDDLIPRITNIYSLDSMFEKSSQSITYVLRQIKTTNPIDWHELNPRLPGDNMFKGQYMLPTGDETVNIMRANTDRYFLGKGYPSKYELYEKGDSEGIKVPDIYQKDNGFGYPYEVYK